MVCFKQLFRFSERKKMTPTNNPEKYGEMLIRKRNEFYDIRSQHLDRRQRLQQLEVEPEEQASRLQMSQGLEQFDEREKSCSEAWFSVGVFVLPGARSFPPLPV
jgi:hypothetical protein